MKNTNKKFILLLSLVSIFVFNSCDPFDDFYLTLSMDTELNAIGAGSNISISSNLCLTDFDDYNDNSDKLEEIRYISSAYFTNSASTGLRGDNLTLRFYQGDGTTLLFEYVVPSFVAANYVNSPLEIKLTQQEIDKINQYLSNPKVNNCFRAELTVSNVQPSNQPYQLNGKVEFLTELKVKL